MTIVKTSTRKQLTIIGHQEKNQNQNKQKTPKQIKEKKQHTKQTNKQKHRTFVKLSIVFFV